MLMQTTKVTPTRGDSCAMCGAVLAPVRRVNASPFCRDACRTAWHREFRPEYRERSARLAQERYASTYTPPTYVKTCAECGRAFVAHNVGRVYCGKECRWAQAYRARRARRFAVVREPYRFAEIAKRDDWVCGICGCLVDPSLAYPAPASGSIDHVVPLSRGGADTRANVQLAHLGCNWRKSDREDGRCE